MGHRRFAEGAVHEIPGRQRSAGALLAATGVVAMSQQQAQATPPGAKDVTATLFRWTYASVAKECASTLGPDGFGFVEVSPATEQIHGTQWWTPSQPVSYR